MTSIAHDVYMRILSGALFFVLSLYTKFKQVNCARRWSCLMTLISFWTKAEFTQQCSSLSSYLQYVFLKVFVGHPSRCSLSFESMTREHMLRLTKCKDSGHNAATRTSKRKCIHWVLKMSLNQVQSSLWWQTANTQVHISTTWVCSVHTNGKSLSSNKLAWKQDKGDSTVCVETWTM